MNQIYIYFILLYLINFITNQNQIIRNKENKNNIIRKLQETTPPKENTIAFNKLFANFKQNWSKLMSDYISQYVYLIPCPYKKGVSYYEKITQVPCSIRGAFLNEDANNENDYIIFKIISPNKTVLYEAKSIGEIFNINITEKGMYMLEFYNEVNKNEIYPTLIMNTGQNLVIEKEGLSETEKKFDDVIEFLKKYEQGDKIERGFRKKRNKSLINYNYYFFGFSFIETFVLISISFWQYYYLKHLFEIKGAL